MIPRKARAHRREVGIRAESGLDFLVETILTVAVLVSVWFCRSRQRRPLLRAKGVASVGVAASKSGRAGAARAARGGSPGERRATSRPEVGGGTSGNTASRTAGRET